MCWQNIFNHYKYERKEKKKKELFIDIFILNDDDDESHDFHAILCIFSKTK